LTRPPVFCQLGHSPSQLQNFCTVANRDTPGPISLQGYSLLAARLQHSCP
jgi:hypothetical protein